MSVPVPQPHQEEAADADPQAARIAALEAQVAELTDALRPFAQEAWKVDPRVGDAAIVTVEVFAGKLRRARTAVEAVQPRRRKLRPVPR